MRKGTVIIWLCVLFGGMGWLFWHNEWVYSLPTPVPAVYKPVEKGEEIKLAAALNPDKKKPLFLHFFNPDCPCSRFNIQYFRSLEKEYADKANFAIVVMSNKNYSEEEIQNKFDLKIPVYTDTLIALSCGVYSTPQAVIIDSNDKLFYRGNYNKSRYCTDKKTEFAKNALNALLQDSAIVFDKFALKAYGCRLPNCNK